MKLPRIPLRVNAALRTLCVALLFSMAVPSHADDVYMGAVVSAGPVIGERGGGYVDATLYGGLGLWLVLGAEAKEFNGEKLNAVYTGIGYTNLLQLHIGASNHGPIYRVKSEFAPFALWNGSLFSHPRDSATSANRLTLSITYENTFENRGLSNVTIGLGYAFN